MRRGKQHMRAICGLYDCDGFNKSCEIRRIEIGYMPEQVSGKEDYCIPSSEINRYDAK